MSFVYAAALPVLFLEPTAMSFAITVPGLEPLAELRPNRFCG